MVIVVNKIDLLPVDSSTPQMKRWIYSLFKAHNITVEYALLVITLEHQRCLFREFSEQSWNWFRSQLYQSYTL